MVLVLNRPKRAERASGGAENRCYGKSSHFVLLSEDNARMPLFHMRLNYALNDAVNFILIEPIKINHFPHED